MANKKTVRGAKGELFTIDENGKVTGIAEELVAEFERIEGDTATIKAKLVDLGLDDGTGTLDALTAEIAAIVNRDAPTIKVKVGETKSIDPGYYKGGTIQTDEEPGDYELTAKTATPTKEVQVITPGPKDPEDPTKGDYYGLSQVTVEQIPDKYQDITETTAEAGDVLSGKDFINAEGVKTTGTMPDNEAAQIVLTPSNREYTIPEGHHDGAGKVSYEPDKKEVTPTKQIQEITPDTGKLLEQVTVGAIPDNYGDVTNADAVAADILAGKKAVTNVGGAATEVTGTMVNNGAIASTFNPLAADSFTVPVGYHNGEGTVSLTADLLNRLRAI